MRSTHTYAVLELSPAAYSEIREKLATAGYQHAFKGDVIDMHGIGVTAESTAQPGSMGLPDSESANVSFRGADISGARSKF
jgi:hypothetical protein